MNLHLIILITIAVLIVALLTIFLVKKEKRPPDYYAFFVMGIIWIGAGIPLKNYGLSGMGFIFMVVGLVNKSKWKANRRTWDQLSDKDKKFKMIMMIGLLALLILGVVTFFVTKNLAG